MTSLLMKPHSKDSFDKVFLYTLLLLFGASMFLIIKYPIAMLRPQYETYADLIMFSKKWLYSVDWNNCICGDGLSDVTTYRTIGYPLIIALNKLLFGTHHIYGILLLQILLWFYSAYAFWEFAKEFGLTSSFRLAFIISYMTGWGWFIQHDCMSDALFTSLFGLIIINIGRQILRDEIESISKSLQSGIILLGLFLIREFTLQLSIIFVSIYVLKLFTNERLTSFTKLFKSALVFYLPILLFAVLQGGWNFYRTDGDFFVTLGARTALQPRIEHAIIVDNAVLNGSLLFDEESKEHILNQIKNQNISNLNFNEFYIDFNSVRNSKLLQNKSQPELTDIFKREYIRLWLNYPKVMQYIIINNLIFFRDIIFLVRPLESLEDYYLYYQRNFGSKKRLPHMSDLLQQPMSQWKWQDVLFVLSVNTFRLISTLIYAMFLFMCGSAGYNAIRKKGKLGTTDQVILFLAILYCGYILSYAVIHIEARYLAAVFPLPAMLGMYGWQKIILLLSKIRKEEQETLILRAA